MPKRKVTDREIDQAYHSPAQDNYMLDCEECEDGLVTYHDPLKNLEHGGYCTCWQGQRAQREDRS